jgi:RNA polymerase sigma-70 factor, ECF subfamily
VAPTTLRPFPVDPVLPTSDESEKRRRLVELITRHQRQIFAYLLSLVPDRASAEDLLQETCMVICDKFDLFREGTDFMAWACQIALWRVRAARQKFARAKVVFDDDVFEAVARTSASMAPELDARHEALTHCLKKLPVRDRELVLTRYERGHGVSEAARHTGRTVEEAYRALRRIRRLLFDCVTQTLAGEAVP